MQFGWLSQGSAAPARFKIWEMLYPRRAMLLNSAAIVLVLIVAAAFTGWNIFGFPHYESDEGTYVGSAWAMFTRGALSYYTYNYDHPPFGWFQIGAWVQLFGGFNAFGMSVNSGRFFMLVVTLLSTLVIYLTVRHVTEAIVPALLAALIFAVSPIGVSLHRQVWIDNLATFWLLLSLYWLVSADRRLDRIVLSGLCFGLAFWSKEVFVVFLPGLLYLSFRQAHDYNRRFAVALWFVTASASISLFLLMALLKDELLPPGVLWSSPDPHVSLIETLRNQAGRDGNGTLLDPNSQFQEFFRQWRNGDPLLMLGGLASMVLALFRWRRDHVLASVALMSGIFLLFLGRGGVVLYYYIIPLLALFAVAIGLALGWIGQLAAGWRISRYGFVSGGMAAAIAVTGLAVPANVQNLRSDRTSGQAEAAAWIADNLPHESVIIMDSYAWVDLREPAFTGGDIFEDAHYFWPAVTNPQISGEVLAENWRNPAPSRRCFSAASPTWPTRCMPNAFSVCTSTIRVLRAGAIRKITMIKTGPGLPPR
jgi:4-amino-4-deoxy-L-arabinose transferase-like glycosyltransferase